ncbi:hypothetical protein QN277_016810 [Acacia crassicarpa]|uniref:DUF868 family protein n=1 Tax=Acacia crassicarpa TaxID=499986 RepID=A0AAE1TAW2_9FABA|nr:hypothetical protein QN277_016810 [Acacia crassicarpa]
MALYRSFREQGVSSRSPIVDRITEEPVPSKSTQSTVTSIYQVNMVGYWRNVTILWTKNYMNHSLHLTVDALRGEIQYNCKIDVKPWHFWIKKGYKSFIVDGHQVEVYWDLRSAKFSGSPEPYSDYYVAVVSDEEIVLLLGDYKKKAYKRTKANTPLTDAVLMTKKENVFAKKSFLTKACFDESGRESDIVVESSSSGQNKDPEMWVSIDGIVTIHVRSLQWKFRGNQTVIVNKQPVQVLWDVHDWLFSENGSGGAGLFIFKPGPLEPDSEREGSALSGCESDDGSGFYSTKSQATNFDFCLILSAYKTE